LEESDTLQQGGATASESGSRIETSSFLEESDTLQQGGATASESGSRIETSALFITMLAVLYCPELAVVW